MALKYEVYDGFDLDGPVYRVVAQCPAVLDDFRAYAELGRPYPSYNHFRATGVSVYMTEEGARGANTKYDLGGGIAELGLNDNRILWALTGGDGHITVWATPAVLLQRVLRCAEDGRVD